MDNYNQQGYGYNQAESSSNYNIQAGYGYDSGTQQGYIVVDNRAKETLQSISKWVKFLAIFGLVGSILIIIAGFFVMILGGIGSSSSGMGSLGAMGAFAGIIYIIIGAIYLYPAMKMLNYANNMKNAIMSNSQNYYEEALSNFKSGVTFMGIVAIIALAFYALAIVGFIFAGIFSSL